MNETIGGMNDLCDRRREEPPNDDRRNKRRCGGRLAAERTKPVAEGAMLRGAGRFGATDSLVVMPRW
jgi:hypothetical protein